MPHEAIQHEFNGMRDDGGMMLTRNQKHTRSGVAGNWLLTLLVAGTPVMAVAAPQVALPTGGPPVQIPLPHPPVNVPSVPPASPPQVPLSHRELPSAPGNGGLTLEQAVARVQNQVGGKVLKADSRNLGRVTEYRIKVLTPDGYVRVVTLRSDGRGN